MADYSGQPHETADNERLTARRVLRARRRREPQKRPARWGLLVALIAIPLTGAAALALRPAQAPAGAVPQPAAQAAPATESELPRLAAAQPEPAPAPVEDTAVSHVAADPVQEPQSQMLGDWLHVRPALGARALHVVYATAGGAFDVRAGDMIVDLCDRPGAESATEIGAALANDGAACLVVRRGGQLLRATRRPARGELEGPAL